MNFKLLPVYIVLHWVLTTGEREEDQEVEKTKFTNIQNHPAQGDLEGAKMRVDWEDVDQLQWGEDVGGSKEALKLRFYKETCSQERQGEDGTRERSGTIFYHLWLWAVWSWPELSVFCLKSFSLFLQRNILPPRWVSDPTYPTVPSAGWRYWGPEIARTAPVTPQIDHLTIEYVITLFSHYTTHHHISPHCKGTIHLENYIIA